VVGLLIASFITSTNPGFFDLFDKLAKDQGVTIPADVEKKSFEFSIIIGPKDKPIVFEMGRRGNSVYKDEKPAHSVVLTKPFAIQKTEVTQLQWTLIMGSNPSGSQSTANRPVETVSYYDIQNFITKLNALDTKYDYRLPTEAEWEYTAGGDKDNVGDYAWVVLNAGESTHNVATKPANNKDKDLYDMFGNVWEWVDDVYSEKAYSSLDKYINPKIVGADNSNRVLRGGSWLTFSDVCRASKRDNKPPDFKFIDVGFRLVRTPKKNNSPVLAKTGNSFFDLFNVMDPDAVEEKSFEFSSIIKQGDRPVVFEMGSRINGVCKNESPIHHNITLTKPFDMQKTEVTQLQWMLVMDDWYSDGIIANRPVETVSYYDIKTFITKLNALDPGSKYEYRLPTEAEWEYAAGSDKDNVGDYAWGVFNAGERTHDVALKLANEFGLYDMRGNVWEWVTDAAYNKNAYSGLDKYINPIVVGDENSNHVLRGGSWRHFSEVCQAAARDDQRPDYRSIDIGFRLVRSPKIAPNF